MVVGSRWVCENPAGCRSSVGCGLTGFEIYHVECEVLLGCNVVLLDVEEDGSTRCGCSWVCVDLLGCRGGVLLGEVVSLGILILLGAEIGPIRCVGREILLSVGGASASVTQLA